MLVSFSVSNYRSIKDKLTLSMLPVKSYKELPNNVASINDKTKLLRSAVIYGANASGKSNVIKSLTDFIDLIKESSKNQLNDKLNIYDPFLLDKASSSSPSGFELEFLVNEIIYIYSVSLDASKIHSESLFYYPKGQRVRIFERTETSHFKYGTVLKGEKKSIENRLLANQLYLSKAANDKLNILVDIFNYFDKVNDMYSLFSYLPNQFSTGALLGSGLKTMDDDYFNRFQKIITALDVGIHSLKIIETTRKKSFLGLLPEDASEILNPAKFLELPKLEYELVSIHKVFNEESKEEEFIEFPLERESSGTKNLLLLASILIGSFNDGTVMIIDEFEKSLHPQIVRKLIQLFHDSEININNAQLIFSTHAISLLDNELFRRDQIWFTEKDEYGVTDLYALSQIEGVRKDIPYDKWYQSGRFGATPIISEPDLNFDNEI